MFCDFILDSRLFASFGSVHAVDQSVSVSATTASLAVVLGGSNGGLASMGLFCFLLLLVVLFLCSFA
jgi:hypothetical protein